MRPRIRVAVLSIAELVALAACTHTGPSSNATERAPGLAASHGVPGDDSFGPGSGTSSLSTHTSGSSATTPSAGTSRNPPPSGRPAKIAGPQLVPPDGSRPSGVICNYVSRTDANGVLPGAGAGQENDVNSVAVSYCAFGSTSLGTVTVGVKYMGTTASSTVRHKYSVMVTEPGQVIHTFAVSGEFAFTVGSSTPLQSGATLYALNAQGSRGSWYVTIQYYSHKSCSTSAMQQLLAAVLSKVPHS